MPTFNLAFKCEPLTHGDAAIREEMVADLAAEALFGESSEQLDQMVIEKFGHLFNEAEGWDASSYEKETKVKSHTRKRRSGSIEDVAAASLRYAARAAS